MQRNGSPLRQRSQFPQKIERQAITRSPGANIVTSSPTASTTPAPSWPSTAGVAIA